MRAPKKNTVRIPITNLVGEGDYTGVFYVGENAQPVNLLLDTGSSTPAINIQDFATTKVLATNYTDHLAYGSLPQGFTGPVVRTHLATGTKEPEIHLKNVYVTVIPSSAGKPFQKADGILGLAYKALNLSTEFNVNTVNLLLDPDTQPIQRGLVELPTYFNELEREGVVPNRFSFYTLRSVPSFAKDNPKTDPLNHGYFILGGGEEATDLYQGKFTSVKIVDDVYYNTNMSAIIIGKTRISIPQFQRQHSNSIVDSGTNGIALPPSIFKQVIEAFGAINTSFVQAINNQSIESLEGWPDIHITLQGESGEVPLTLSPDTYWQLHSPEYGQAIFAIRSSDINQVILGLPLMNNYYTIFDRSAEVIKFAPIKKP